MKKTITFERVPVLALLGYTHSSGLTHVHSCFFRAYLRSFKLPQSLLTLRISRPYSRSFKLPESFVTSCFLFILAPVLKVIYIVNKMLDFSSFFLVSN